MQDNKIVILVSGGRDFDSVKMVSRAIKNITLIYPEDTEFLLVEGGAIGADFLSRALIKYLAELYGFKVEVKTHKADWNKYKKAAGAIRNSEMLKEYEVDYFICFPGDEGTRDMWKKVEAFNKKSQRQIKVSDYRQDE